MMKIISVGQSNLDIEYKGRIVRLSGDLLSPGFLAWANFMEWLPYNPDAPMTVDEKLEVIRSSNKYRYISDDKYIIEFVDDRTGKRYSDPIFFDSHGEPLVHIEGEIIKSIKLDYSCRCELTAITNDEANGFSDFEFTMIKFDIEELTRNRVLRKVHVWKRYENYKEEWYKCKKCGKVWSLVYPKELFRGLWRRVK